MNAKPNTETTNPKFYTEGGRGRKKCEHCEKYSPAVMRTCQNPECGKAFPAPSPKKKNTTPHIPDEPKYIQTARVRYQRLKLQLEKYKEKFAEYEMLKKMFGDD